jgi:RNA polymerase sigma factor (sigma-70 family)
MAREAFLTTRWTLIRTAAGEGAEARAALEELCAATWYPLYAYVRRSGVRAEDAEDLVQGFFARLIERRDLSRLTRGAGRFRGFLLAALRHHLAHERDRARALKRGGGRAPLSLDLSGAGERFAREPVLEETPERTFQRLWALDLLAACVSELEAEYAASGRARIFAALRGVLQGERPDPEEVARRLDMRPGAVRVAVHRLRRRFAQLLRLRVSRTVASDEEVEEELDELMRALAGRGV